MNLAHMIAHARRHLNESAELGRAPDEFAEALIEATSLIEAYFNADDLWLARLSSELLSAPGLRERRVYTDTLDAAEKALRDLVDR